MNETWIFTSFADVSTAEPEYRKVVKMITELVGQPKSYGLSPEEQEEEERRLKEEQEQKLALEAAERKHRNEAALAEMAIQYEQWVGAEGQGKKQIIRVNMFNSVLLFLSRKIGLK